MISFEETTLLFWLKNDSQGHLALPFQSAVQQFDVTQLNIFLNNHTHILAQKRSTEASRPALPIWSADD